MSGYPPGAPPSETSSSGSVTAPYRSISRWSTSPFTFVASRSSANVYRAPGSIPSHRMYRSHMFAPQYSGPMIRANGVLTADGSGSGASSGHSRNTT